MHMNILCFSTNSVFFDSPRFEPNYFAKIQQLSTVVSPPRTQCVDAEICLSDSCRNSTDGRYYCIRQRAKRRNFTSRRETILPSFTYVIRHSLINSCQKSANDGVAKFSTSEFLFFFSTTFGFFFCLD